MLPAVHRLADADVFRHAARSGRRAASRTLVVHLLSAGDSVAESPVRVGFVVSKAVGNAVIRNRVKRRLRPLVREQLSLFPAGSVLVVRALTPAASAPSAELSADLTRCLEGVRG